MLFGHSSSITCLARANENWESANFVSAAENGYESFLYVCLSICSSIHLFVCLLYKYLFFCIRSRRWKITKLVHFFCFFFPSLLILYRYSSNGRFINRNGRISCSFKFHHCADLQWNFLYSIIFCSEIFLWDVSDGRCIEQTKVPGVHLTMHVSVEMLVIQCHRYIYYWYMQGILILILWLHIKLQCLKANPNSC